MSRKSGNNVTDKNRYKSLPSELRQDGGNTSSELRNTSGDSVLDLQNVSGSSHKPLEGSGKPAQHHLPDTEMQLEPQVCSSPSIRL